MNPHDPYEMAAFAEETDALRRDIAERQERQAAGLDREWRAPVPEPANAAVSRGPQMHSSREWAAWQANEIEVRVAARVQGLREEIADVLADLAKEYDAKFVESERVMKAEFEAAVRGLVAGIRAANGLSGEADIVLPMDKAMRPRH